MPSIKGSIKDFNSNSFEYPFKTIPKVISLNQNQHP